MDDKEKEVKVKEEVLEDKSVLKKEERQLTTLYYTVNKNKING